MIRNMMQTTSSQYSGESEFYLWKEKNTNETSIGIHWNSNKWPNFKNKQCQNKCEIKLIKLGDNWRVSEEILTICEKYQHKWFNRWINMKPVWKRFNSTSSRYNFRSKMIKSNWNSGHWVIFFDSPQTKNKQQAPDICYKISSSHRMLFNQQNKWGDQMSNVSDDKFQ